MARIPSQLEENWTSLSTKIIHSTKNQKDRIMKDLNERCTVEDKGGQTIRAPNTLGARISPPLVLRPHGHFKFGLSNYRPGHWGKEGHGGHFQDPKKLEGCLYIRKPLWAATFQGGPERPHPLQKTQAPRRPGMQIKGKRARNKKPKENEPLRALTSNPVVLSAGRRTSFFFERRKTK